VLLLALYMPRYLYMVFVCCRSRLGRRSLQTLSYLAAALATPFPTKSNLFGSELCKPAKAPEMA